MNMIELGVEATVVDFIQSRVSSSVLARHYLNLAAIADRKYEKFARWLKYLLQGFI